MKMNIEIHKMNVGSIEFDVPKHFTAEQKETIYRETLRKWVEKNVKAFVQIPSKMENLRAGSVYIKSEDVPKRKYTPEQEENRLLIVKPAKKYVYKMKTIFAPKAEPAKIKMEKDLPEGWIRPKATFSNPQWNDLY